MLSSRTQSLLADYLKSVAEAETSVEIARQVLAEKKDFKPYSAFSDLDQLGKGYLTVRDLTDFLQDLDLVPLESHVRGYFSLYDSNDDGRLSFSDFKNAVLPATDSYLRELALNRPTFRSDQPLSYAASWALARVFEKDMISSKNLEYKRKELAERYDWDLHTAFRTIDQERFGYIDPEAIMLFFDECGTLLTSKENDALFRRADKDGDGRISISEFKRLLEPLSGYDRQISTGSPIKKSRSPSPRRLEMSSPVYGTPSRLSQERVGSPMISDADYYRYLQESSRLSSGRKNAGYSSPRRSRDDSGRLSPRASSPRLKKELTDYRVDSGYRTVRKYDDAEDYRASSRNYRASSPSGRASPRSRSPRLISEMTDYRVTSNYRTVKAYDGGSPMRESSRVSADRQYESQWASPQRRKPDYSSYNQSYSSSRRRSPQRYQQEETTYRKEKGYRTVKVFDKNEPESEKKSESQAEEKKPEPQTEEKKSEPESGIKEYSEEPKSKENNEEITKKLEFEEPQQVEKAEKPYQEDHSEEPQQQQENDGEKESA